MNEWSGADLLDHIGDVLRVAEVVEVERQLGVDDGQRFGDFQLDVGGVVVPLTRFRAQCRLRGAVRQRVVGHPRRQVVVKRFGVDDSIAVHQADLRHQRLVDGVVDVAGLDEQFVGQDGVVGCVVVPALLVDASGGQIAVEGFLQGDEPVAEEAQPEFRKAAVVVFDDLGDAGEGVVVLVQQPAIIKFHFIHYNSL